MRPPVRGLPAVLMHRVPDRITPLIAKLLFLCLSTNGQTLKPFVLKQVN